MHIMDLTYSIGNYNNLIFVFIPLKVRKYIDLYLCGCPQHSGPAYQIVKKKKD